MGLGLIDDRDMVFYDPSDVHRVPVRAEGVQWLGAAPGSVMVGQRITGLGGEVTIRSLAINPADGRTVRAGNGSGVYNTVEQPGYRIGERSTAVIWPGQ
jgi:hypothetical protein